MRAMHEALEGYVQGNHPGTVFEENNKQIRAIHGCHLYDVFFDNIVQDPLFVQLSRCLLEDEVYVHQLKVNWKAALEGKSWPWHRDYPFWSKFDHIASPDLLNICVFLDDVTPFNGPLCVVPGSHNDPDVEIVDDEAQEEWSAHVSEKLALQVARKDIVRLMQTHGAQFITGRSGDVLAFSPQLVHSSYGNLSANDRKLMIITYNSVSNTPCSSSDRPEFLCARNWHPVSKAGQA